MTIKRTDFKSFCILSHYKVLLMKQTKAHRRWWIAGGKLPPTPSEEVSAADLFMPHSWREGLLHLIFRIVNLIWFHSHRDIRYLRNVQDMNAATWADFADIIFSHILDPSVHKQRDSERRAHLLFHLFCAKNLLHNFLRLTCWKPSASELPAIWPLKLPAEFPDCRLGGSIVSLHWVSLIAVGPQHGLVTVPSGNRSTINGKSSQAQLACPAGFMLGRELLLVVCLTTSAKALAGLLGLPPVASPGCWEHSEEPLRRQSLLRWSCIRDKLRSNAPTLSARENILVSSGAHCGIRSILPLTKWYMHTWLASTNTAASRMSIISASCADLDNKALRTCNSPTTLGKVFHKITFAALISSCKKWLNTIRLMLSFGYLVE